MTMRSERVGDEMRRILADLLQKGLKDPRLPDLVSITSVTVSRDLSHAKVFYSVLGSDEEKKRAGEVLESAKGFLRREVGQRIQLRGVPSLVFVADNSIEHGFAMDRLIDDVLAKDQRDREENEET